MSIGQRRTIFGICIRYDSNEPAQLQSRARSLTVVHGHRIANFFAGKIAMSYLLWDIEKHCRTRWDTWSGAALFAYIINFKWTCNILPNNSLIQNGFTKLIRVGNSIRQKWVNYALSYDIEWISYRQLKLCPIFIGLLNDCLEMICISLIILFFVLITPHENITHLIWYWCL